MDIKRRIYADKTTGNVLVHRAEQKNTFAIRETTIEEDIAAITELSERNRDSILVKEFEIGELQTDFEGAVLKGIDVNTLVPIFAYPDPNAPSEPIVELVPLSVQLAETKEELDMLGMNLVEKDMQIMALESSNDFLGGQLVAKDFEIFGLQNESNTQGEQLVAIDIRLMMGGL